MKVLVLALSVACFALVASAATRAILSEPRGAESAGPVPSARNPGTRPGEKATTPRQNASTDTENSATEPGVPKVDYTIDLHTGVMTPLPRAIIRSLGKSSEPRRGAPGYAASPDGSHLAYVGIGDEGSLQIFTAGLDGTKVRQVTHDPRGATSPAWSPNGTRIAYGGHGSEDVRNLFVLDVATGQTRQVTAGTHDVWDSQFMPDGSSLIYTGGTNEVPLLMTVPVAGGKSTLLIKPEGDHPDSGNGSMSPDGSLVTFLGSGTPVSAPSYSYCGPCRWLANADGTERRVIPGCFESNPAGTWSPEGGRIVCSTNTESGEYSVIVVDIATGDVSRVAEGRAAIWLDRHTLLVEVS
jgi:Tol biopolymer transport system component